LFATLNAKIIAAAVFIAATAAAGAVVAELRTTNSLLALSVARDAARDAAEGGARKSYAASRQADMDELDRMIAATRKVQGK